MKLKPRRRPKHPRVGTDLIVTKTGRFTQAEMNASLERSGLYKYLPLAMMSPSEPKNAIWMKRYAEGIQSPESVVEMKRLAGRKQDSIYLRYAAKEICKCHVCGLSFAGQGFVALADHMYAFHPEELELKPLTLDDIDNAMSKL